MAYTCTGQFFSYPYSPFDSLTLRASMGSSFVAPCLTQLNSPESCGLTNVSDPFTTFAAFTANCSRGNPNLVPESADTKSVGFELDLIEGMRLQIDWSETDFTDRIVTSTASDVLATDYFNFQQATGFAGPGKPSLAQLAARESAAPLVRHCLVDRLQTAAQHQIAHDARDQGADDDAQTLVEQHVHAVQQLLQPHALQGQTGIGEGEHGQNHEGHQHVQIVLPVVQRALVRIAL